MRLNPYLLPHKGLRYLLAKVSLLAGNLDNTLPKEVDQLKALSNELFFLLEQHAHVEDHMILPDLEKKCPGSTEENHEEHEYLEGLVAQLQTQVNALQPGSDPNAPKVFFEALMEVIGEEMDPRPFTVLRESLEEGALVH
ncbi:hypothetical protein ADIS_1231 [Lunatimonas lonarensis]|uniref:Hemerythrin-like domain-containing protein n=2 Tax=Lunatimonas lonarensis TaxID=1232681 RepID=R7ZWH5_9BACT|nr:hypothetical protein ADIS_1231 [Lunatimonas lonarensis]